MQGPRRTGAHVPRVLQVVLSEHTEARDAAPPFGHSEYGGILPDSWRFIDGIPEACPLLTDEFIRYEHPCLECMKKAGIKVIENETINENKP